MGVIKCRGKSYWWHPQNVVILGFVNIFVDMDVINVWFLIKIEEVYLWKMGIKCAVTSSIINKKCAVSYSKFNKMCCFSLYIS